MQGQNVPVFMGIDLVLFSRCPYHTFLSYCEPLSVSGLIRRL